MAKAKVIRSARMYLGNSETGLGLPLEVVEQITSELKKLPDFQFDWHAVTRRIDEQIELRRRLVDQLSRSLEKPLALARQLAKFSSDDADQDADRVRALEHLANDLPSLKTSPGRAKKSGSFWVTLAIYGALFRGGVPTRRIPAVLRVCLPSAGLTTEETNSAIKKLTTWRKEQELKPSKKTAVNSG